MALIPGHSSKSSAFFLVHGHRHSLPLLWAHLRGGWEPPRIGHTCRQQSEKCRNRGGAWFSAVCRVSCRRDLFSPRSLSNNNNKMICQQGPARCPYLLIYLQSKLVSHHSPNVCVGLTKKALCVRHESLTLTLKPLEQMLFWSKFDNGVGVGVLFLPVQQCFGKMNELNST